MKTTIETEPLFTLEETANIVQQHPQKLREWIASGFITPERPGGRGQGRTHRFSVKQVAGLCYAFGLHGKPRGMFRDDFLRTATFCSEWPMSAVERLLGLRSDDWSEEAFVKAVGFDPTKRDDPFAEPLSNEVLKMVRLLMRLRQAVRERLGLERSNDRRTASKASTR